MEQPQALSATISPRISPEGRIVLDGISLTAAQLKKVSRIYIVACGSAYHAGVVGKYVLEKLTRSPVEVDLASEFRYRDPIVDSRTLVLIISQSGETADTLAALREAKKQGPGPVHRQCGGQLDRVGERRRAVYLGGAGNFGRYDQGVFDSADHAVPHRFLYCGEARTSTTGISAACSALWYGCRTWCREFSVRLPKSSNWPSGMPISSMRISSGGTSIMRWRWRPPSSSRRSATSIPRHTPRESSNTAPSPSLRRDVCCGPGLHRQGDGKTLSNVKEVRARGAEVLLVTTDDNRDVTEEADHILYIPKTNDLLMPSLEVVPMQLLGYYIALARKCDIDKPRNLAKSVTVE